MHTGIEIEGSMHLGKKLLFVSQEDEYDNDVDSLLAALRENNCEGFYFGANLTLPSDEWIPKIAELVFRTGPNSTIEIPIMDRGRWLRRYRDANGLRGLNGLHVIHRLNDMHAFAASQEEMMPTDDLKIFSPSTGQVITWRYDTGTMPVYPRDYEGDQQL